MLQVQRAQIRQIGKHIFRQRGELVALQIQLPQLGKACKHAGRQGGKSVALQVQLPQFGKSGKHIFRQRGEFGVGGVQTQYPQVVHAGKVVFGQRCNRGECQIHLGDCAQMPGGYIAAAHFRLPDDFIAHKRGAVADTAHNDLL